MGVGVDKEIRFYLCPEGCYNLKSNLKGNGQRGVRRREQPSVEQELGPE